MNSRRSDKKAHIRALLDAGPESMSGPVEARRLAAEVQVLAREVCDPLLEGEAVLQVGRHRLSMMHPKQTLERLDWARRVFASNQRPDRVAACDALRARALLDLGCDTRAIDVASALLQEPMAARVDRVHAKLIKSLALMRLGRIDEATAITAQRAVPQARSIGGPFLISHALIVHALGLIFDYARRRLPNGAFTGVTTLVQSLSDEAPGVTSISHVLDEAQAALPAGQRWNCLDGVRHFFVGLTGDRRDAERAISDLTDLAVSRLGSDPPHVGWLLILRGSIQHHIGATPQAILSMTQATKMADDLGLLCQARRAQGCLSLLYESAGNTARALEAHKRFLSLHTLSMLSSETDSDGDEHGPIAELWGRPPAAAVGHAVPPVARYPARRTPASVQRALSCIDGWDQGKLSVGDVVQASGVGRRTLELAIRDFCNSTVSELIRLRGLRRAAQRLTHTVLSVAEIAKEAGYRSAESFGQAFRTHYGLSPSEWRREHAVEAPRGTSGRR